MKFISGEDTLEAVARFLKSEETEIALAVAFWGGDAIGRLGLKEWKAKRVRVICNATSGACNPQALIDLLSHVESHAGWSLHTNARLHAKVYWTPKRLVVTSANASASGLSLQDKEIDGNIEAGVDSVSPALLESAKVWFNEIYDQPETVEVDDQIINLAERRWMPRRRIRESMLGNNFSVTDALRQGTSLIGRNIWVRNYDGEEVSKEAERQCKRWQEKWKTRELRPPVVASAEGVKFDAVASYEEYSLNGYHWNSWIIDLASGERCFWFIPDKNNIIRHTKTISIPCYETKKIPLGIDEWMSVSRTDIKTLRDKWKTKLGARSDEWVPLHKFAD